MKERNQADNADVLQGKRAGCPRSHMTSLYGSVVSFYDYFAAGLTGDVQFYVEEAEKAGSPVLELGCGTGRILIPVAESGTNIVGLDNSPDMLSIARQKVSNLSADAQKRIELVEGDMRSFSLGRQRFKLIMIPYRAFLHLMTSEDQRQSLTCIREHLADGGRLVLNMFDPRLDIIAEHMGPLGAAVKKVDEFTHPDTGHKVLVWGSRKYDPLNQTNEQYFIFEELDDAGKVISKTYSLINLRFVYRYEMQHLLELCGYRIEALYGDFQRGPFQYGGEQIWIACKSNSRLS